MKRVVAELTFTTAGDGTTETFYAATIGFSTRSGDTPASTHIPGRLKSAGRIVRNLFSGARVTGGVKPSFGELVLLNSDGELDVWRTYGGGGRVVIRIGEESAAYPDAYTTVLIAYVHSVVVDTGTTDDDGRQITPDLVRVYLRGREQVFDQLVVSSGFAGTGGVEGSAGVSGVRQIVSGDPGFIPPTLVDASKNLYHVQENPTDGLSSFFALYEGGVEITRGDDYASESELLLTAPDEGECRFYFGTSVVYVRTHGTPTNPLRVYALGGDGSGRGYYTFGALAERAGIPTADIDFGTFGGVFGGLITEETYAEVMDGASLAESQWYGFTRLDRFTYGRLQDPADGTSVYTFTPDNSKGWKRSPVSGMEAPIWKVILRAGKAYPAQVAAGASATMKDYLSREWWWTVTGESSTSRLAYPNATTAIVEIPPRFIQNSFGAEQYLARFFGLYGGRRDFFSLTTEMTDATLDIELHDVVTLEHPTRFGLSSGQPFRVISQDIDITARRITFGLWGGDTGEYTGTGGSTPSSASSDAYVIQAEDAEFLRTEDGFVLLIETDASLIQAEDDQPIYTQTSAPVLTE